jgi:ComF family protein
MCQLCGQPTDVPGLCWYCQRTPLSIGGIRSAFLFTGGVRQAIHRLKYDNRRSLTEILARLMADYWRENPMPVDLLVPVPLHPARQRERGYNQAELLARSLGGMIDLPVVITGLRRVRHTPPQMSLSAADRRENVWGAFVYRAEAGDDDNPISDQRILVIDDVCTTGSTLEACSLALKAAGASAVWGFTLARAYSRGSE